MEDQALIVDSGNKWVVGAQITINAPASEIFAIVSNPRMHPEIDGSKMVKGGITGPDQLKLGDTFYMHMSIGIPYVMRNKVVEYKHNEIIGWRPLAHNTWRYELKPITANSTLVTQWMDGRKAPKLLMKREIQWAAKAIAKTLVNLKKIAEK
jgi:Polyketide cyclase / dehydrase and lipid transport